MITRILVPTDFSKAANNALQFALKFAQNTHAEVHLLHINDIPVSEDYIVANAYTPYLKSLEADAGKEFEKLRKRYYKNSTIKFQSATAIGNVYTEIHSFAKKKKTDLIIMGTRGASGLEVLFGSVAASVVVKSPVPVLVVPPSAKYEEFRHIVYATNFNEPEFPAVSRLIYLAQLYKARITVLHIKSETDRYFAPEHNFFVKNRKNISYKNWVMVNLDDENVMQGITRFIDQSGADLLVLAKHNRSFFERLFHRSLSKRMAYHTNIPLLVLTEESKKGK